jgi:hypothetical protein
MTATPRSASTNLLAKHPLHHDIIGFVTASCYQSLDRVLAVLNTL